MYIVQQREVLHPTRLLQTRTHRTSQNPSSRSPVCGSGLWLPVPDLCPHNVHQHTQTSQWFMMLTLTDSTIQLQSYFFWFIKHEKRCTTTSSNRFQMEAVNPAHGLCSFCFTAAYSFSPTSDPSTSRLRSVCLGESWNAENRLQSYETWSIKVFTVVVTMIYCRKGPDCNNICNNVRRAPVPLHVPLLQGGERSEQGGLCVAHDGPVVVDCACLLSS